MMPHFVRRGTSGTPSPTQDLEWDVCALFAAGRRGNRPRQNSLFPLERKECVPVPFAGIGFVSRSQYIELLP